MNDDSERAGEIPPIETPPIELPIEDVLDLHSFLPKDVPNVVRDYLDAWHERRYASLDATTRDRHAARYWLDDQERNKPLCMGPNPKPTNVLAPFVLISILVAAS